MQLLALRNKKQVVGAAFGFGVIGLWLVSGSPILTGYDSFYHVKMALLLPEEGFLKSLSLALLDFASR
jgi:hypothetical protein